MFQAWRTAVQAIPTRARALWLWLRSRFPLTGRMLRFTWRVLQKYYNDDCFSYAASLSFWIIISLVPMGTLLFKLLGLVLGHQAYAEATQTAIEQLVPFLPHGFVEDAISHSQEISGTALSWAVLLFGSYWSIAQIDTSLAHVFGLRIKKDRQTRKNPLLRQLSLLIGGLLLMALFMALLVGGVLHRHLPYGFNVVPWLAFLFYVLVMAVVLQHIPRLHVSFRHAFLGASISAALWWLAKWGFSVYLAHTFTWGIMYGSLVGIVAALTFLYYSCAIFLLGAEITAAFYRAEPLRKGSPPR